MGVDLEGRGVLAVAMCVRSRKPVTGWKPGMEAWDWTSERLAAGTMLFTGDHPDCWSIRTHEIEAALSRAWLVHRGLHYDVLSVACHIGKSWMELKSSLGSGGPPLACV